MTFRQENDMIFPKFIILDLSSDIVEFKKQLDKMPYLDEFCNDVLKSIIEYIADGETAQANISEYVSELEDQFNQSDIYININLVLSEVFKLSNAILNQLFCLNFYSYCNALWYEFDRLVGNDVMLKSIKSD